MHSLGFTRSTELIPFPADQPRSQHDPCQVYRLEQGVLDNRKRECRQASCPCQITIAAELEAMPSPKRLKTVHRKFNPTLIPQRLKNMERGSSVVASRSREFVPYHWCPSQLEFRVPLSHTLGILVLLLPCDVASLRILLTVSGSTTAAEDRG